MRGVFRCYSRLDSLQYRQTLQYRTARKQTPTERLAESSCCRSEAKGEPHTLNMWLFIVSVPCGPFQTSETSGVAIVSALNARFRAGTVSDDPAAAGVVLHALNDQLGTVRPWLSSGPYDMAAISAQPWLSSERGARVSCVIANARLPFIWHGWHREPYLRSPGFVLRSSVVKRALLCAYGHDGATDLIRCPGNWRASPNKCTPGCPSETNPGRIQSDRRRWRRAIVASQGSEFRTARSWDSLNLSQAMLLHEERVAKLSARLPSDKSASPAASLERARLVMQQKMNQYNELVLAADTCNSLLPGTIEAVYTCSRTQPSRMACKSRPNGRERYSMKPYGLPSLRRTRKGARDSCTHSCSTTLT